MNKKTKTINRQHQVNKTQETTASGKMRFFYILMLLLMIFSLVLRVSGTRRSTTAQPGGGTAARTLVFHLEENNSCEDLVITSTGNAVLSNCGKGLEKQYTLNSSERAQLQTWVEKYSAVNYDHSDPAQASAFKAQLFLKGRGTRQANAEEVQQLIAFSESLASKILSQS